MTSLLILLSFLSMASRCITAPVKKSTSAHIAMRDLYILGSVDGIVENMISKKSDNFDVVMHEAETDLAEEARSEELAALTTAP